LNTFGPYELIKQIGVGGMAEVWLARDKNKNLCAIKRILPHLSKEERFIEMFLDEGKIAAKFDHPNIVEIHDVGTIDNVSFMAMEFLDGGDLADILDCIENTTFQIPINTALEIVALATDALGYAHRFKDKGVPQNIIHRDISPHNILITKEGRVCLVDFGVAKAIDRHAKTETGIVKGKLSYMSPEQVQQEEMDHRSDLFSMGVVLYELLTLQTPFGRELKAVSGILHMPTPDPRALRPELDASIVQLIYTALEKSPDKRFASAFEMASAIRSIQAAFYPKGGPKLIRDLYTKVAAIPRPPDPIFQVDDSKAALFSQTTKENDQNQIIDGPVVNTKNNKLTYLIGLLILALLSGWGIYEISKDDTPNPTLARASVEKKGEIERVTETPASETPLFKKILATLSLRTHLRQPLSLTHLEMKKVLNYRIGVDTQNYLIDKKVNRFTNIFEDEPNEKTSLIDPGNPKAKFNLRTTLAERRQRRKDAKDLRKIRAERLRKKTLAERRKKKRKQKRKDKLIDKAIPSGM